MDARKLIPFLVTLAGCEGLISGPRLFAPLQPQPNSPAETPGEPPAMYVAPEATLRLLTASQFSNAVLQFAPDAQPAPALPNSSIAAAQASLNDTLVQDIEVRALAIATGLIAKPAFRAKFSCDLSQTPCRKTIVSQLAEVAFRRPLEPDEVTEYLGLFDSEATRFSDAWRGLEFVLVALFESPQFVYRVELDDTKGQYDGPALASRLSFLLTNGPPDDALRVAGFSGQLADAAVRRAQAERLLKLQLGRRGVNRFFEDWFQLDKVARLEKSATVFPLFSPAVAAAMREQAMRVAEDLVFTRRDARALFEDTGVDVNDTLAPVYGLTLSGNAAWRHLAPGVAGARPGLLAWPALLSLHAKPTKTSVTERGVFLRKDVLCTPVPLPPDNVPPLPIAAPGENLTTRQLFERHRVREPCKTCHTYFDPLGITLETFDGIGRPRTTENGIPIDASGEFDGVQIADANGLAAHLRQQPESMRCIAEQLHRYTAGHVTTAADAPLVNAMAKRFSTLQFDFQALLLDYVTAPEFSQVRRAP
jgi:Protein of unknown function (DUF1588)/Protein of unknown function (DUF1592)/Protein of unknown function (DUF1595)/Protein of unknown function (DUF1585)